MAALAIASFAVSAELANIQFSIHDKESSTLQLIKGISNDLQKLLKYLNSETILTPFKSSALFVSPTNYDLYLNDEELTIGTFALFSISSLLNCYKISDVSE